MTAPNQPPDQARVSDEPDRQLTLLGQAANALAAPDAAIEAIAGHLDALFDAGAPAAALDAIHTNAVDLAQAISQHQAALRAGLELAQRIQQQRDHTRQALDDLKAAIHRVDTNVPEIETMYDDIEQMVIEWQSLTWADDTWEYVINLLSDNSGLEIEEIDRMLNLLNGDGPGTESDLWADLREWMDHAESDACDVRAEQYRLSE